MQMTMREWTREDLPQIQRVWLEHFRGVARGDMQLRRDADSAMKQWLAGRFRHPQTFGFVAEAAGGFAGFLIGRLGDWESAPPVIEPRRIGIIDAVYVGQPFRRQGIGRLLIDKALDKMRAANAVAAETIYDAWDEAAVQSWHRAGFAPWMVHAYRML